MRGHSLRGISAPPSRDQASMDDSQEEVTWTEGGFFHPFFFFWRKREKKAHEQEKQSLVLAGKGGACMPNGEMGC